ncbi:cell polarity protein-like protein [Zopfia rhizophila CBS 207.26]|uniref:Cell polarity protein-like protein n=1 Tax=Zopfia rhizophila CBS 207.26 TaxID=1314779 RepID=A0A6A6E666_9PEZI|nr:cell polarity protein-like protein [Zopfia rhizophila CBS 207.26]
MMNGRNGTLSPVSTDSNDWSPITRYQNIGGSDNPYSPTLPSNNRGITPPASVHTSTSTSDGGMPNGMGRSGASNGNPSPPSSVGRSSDGTGLYASSMTDASISSRKMLILEETLAEHYRVLKGYLAPYLRDEKGNPRPSRAKDKLTRLSAVQFQELSTDVYDESLRREADRKRGGPNAPGNDTPKFLLPKNNFHPKRNQARQKLSTLPLERFRQLATDVFYELERRFPRFTGPDIERMGSPAGSIASRTSRGPPSRVGTPNSMNGGMRGRPAPGAPGFRNGPPGPPGPGGPGFRPGSQSNEFGRPLPKTFQQNTIVPNKGTMVEDDDDDSGVNDDDDDGDAFDLEGAAPRQSRRQTNKSLKSMSVAQDKTVSDLQSQVSQLQDKVDSLEGTLQSKNGEIQRLQDADRNKDTTAASERAEWDDLRYSLERKVEEAQNLNSSLRSEIEKIRTENSDNERDLRAQISDLEMNARQQQSYNNGGGQWRQRCEELERELSEQQQIAEEVRQDASQFLQEMRQLSSRSDAALEKEEQLSNQVSSLEVELKEWKSRYARAKTQLRNLKASSIGLASLASPAITNYARDATFTTPDGLVKDVHVTKFQLSIDELLQVARRQDQEQVLESMKHVVKCVRAITGDIDSVPLSQVQSPSSSVNGDGTMSPEKQQAKLKSRVSATANNLITASKNHASAGGLSPVSLLDAAASHLSTAIVELVKHVKVRPSPEDELERDEEDDRPMPLKPNGFAAYSPFTPNSVNGNGIGLGHMRHRSRGGSSESAGYSNMSSSYSGYGRQSGGLDGMGIERDTGMTEFKNYLDDQTALLVQSIQPLVHMIRSSPMSTPADEQQISDYIQDISRAVQDTGSRAHEAVKDLSSPALKKHAIPVVAVLEDCRQSLLEMEVRDGGQERIPPLAFKTARAMKELVLRVERIETGELTVDQVLKNDF